MREKKDSTATGKPFNSPGHSLADLNIAVIERVKKNDLIYRKEREEHHTGCTILLATPKFPYVPESRNVLNWAPFEITKSRTCHPQKLTESKTCHP